MRPQLTSPRPDEGVARRVKMDCGLIPVGYPWGLVAPAALHVGPTDQALVPVARAGVVPDAMEFVDREAAWPFAAPAVECGLAVERLRLVCTDWPGVESTDRAVAGDRADWGAERLAAPDFPFQARAAAAAVWVQTVLALAFAHRAGARPGHEVDIGISRCEPPTVAPRQDNEGRNTVADTLATGPVQEPHCGSNDPTLHDAVPIAGPSAGPSVVVHLGATRESKVAAHGSSAQGYAE